MEETITWHLLPELPDDGIDVMLSTTNASNSIAFGYWDSESDFFRYAMGEPVSLYGDKVLGWAEIPAGVKPDAA